MVRSCSNCLRVPLHRLQVFLDAPRCSLALHWNPCRATIIEGFAAPTRMEGYFPPLVENWHYWQLGLAPVLLPLAVLVRLTLFQRVRF